MQTMTSSKAKQPICAGARAHPLFDQTTCRMKWKLGARHWCEAIAFFLGMGLTMSAAATLAPIQADASVRYTPGTSNTHVNDNYGALEHIVVGAFANGGRGRAFVRFSLSTLPVGTVGADVERATLLLKVREVAGTGEISPWVVTSTWNESTVTFATQPTAVGPPGSFTTITGALVDQYIAFDVTGVVRSWLDNTVPNNGLAFSATGLNFYVTFSSKESDSEPVLDITLSSGGGAAGPPGPAGAAGAAATISVGSTLTSAAGSAAMVNNSGSSSAALFNFTIPRGSDGATGPVGAAGPAGTTGLPGTNGNTLLSGTVAPTPPVGVDGDFYVNISANVLFGPKVLGAWPATGVSLVGPAGTDGVAGVPGATGSTGAQGPVGATGATGAPGIVGAAGATGAQGLAGATGAQGVQGPQGPVGPAGPARFRVYPDGTTAPEFGYLDQINFWWIATSPSRFATRVGLSTTPDPVTHKLNWFIASLGGDIYWTVAGCTGDPYSADAPYSIDSDIVAVSTGTLTYKANLVLDVYSPDFTQSTVQQSFPSRRQPNGSCINTSSGSLKARRLILNPGTITFNNSLEMRY